MFLVIYIKDYKMLYLEIKTTLTFYVKIFTIGQYKLFVSINDVADFYNWGPHEIAILYLKFVRPVVQSCTSQKISVDYFCYLLGMFWSLRGLSVGRYFGSGRGGFRSVLDQPICIGITKLQ